MYKRRASPKKLTVLSRISKLAILNQLEKMVNSFINSQLSYCPLIWMFISKVAINEMIETEVYKYLNGLSP